MTIEEAQQTVDRWIKTTGVRYFNELTNMAILVEEVGEVAASYPGNTESSLSKNLTGEKELSDELADVLFVVICLANQTGIDLTKALEKNLKKKTGRDAKRHRANKKLK